MDEGEIKSLLTVLETNFNYFSVLKKPAELKVWSKYLQYRPADQAKVALDHLLNRAESLNDFTADLLEFKKSYRYKFPESNSGRMNGFSKTECCNFGTRFILMGGDAYGIKPLSKKTLVANKDKPIVEVMDPVLDDADLIFATNGKYYKGTIYKMYKSSEVPCNCIEGHKFNKKKGYNYSIETMLQFQCHTFKTIPDLLEFYETQLLPLTNYHIPLTNNHIN